MRQVERFSVGPLQTNCYFIWAATSNQAVIVDPGAEGEFLSEELVRRQLQARFIFFTHAHFDHLAGALDIFLNFSPPPTVFLHSYDFKLYSRARFSAKFFAGFDPGPSLPKKNLISDLTRATKELTQVLQTPVQLLPIPGHSPGQTALYLPKTPAQLFAGDLIFASGYPGRTDFPYSNRQQMQSSLQLIQTLPPQVQVFPGHEDEFYLSDFPFA
jgi:glyoxylase-like metal-dependent hydrolase (beta-lactamase superfamily II)